MTVPVTYLLSALLVGAALMGAVAIRMLDNQTRRGNDAEAMKWRGK